MPAVVRDAAGPDHGFVGFDHIFVGLLTVYRVMNLEWLSILHLFQDAWHPAALVFFLLLVLLLPFFATNLVLA